MIKLYIGGSPCTHWSIAQTKNRETEPSGLGWELFENYLIGLKKYKPDYFLYENNKSMSPAIREQITKELGVEPILINSALVSAQNRQRLYWTNIPGITQPEDRGILLRDILETGVAWNEKAYCLTASYQFGVSPHDTISKSRRSMDAEPVEVLNINPSGRGMNGAVIHTNWKSRTLTTNKGEGQKIIEPVPINDQDGKARTIKSQYAKTSIANLTYSASYGATMVVEPMKVTEATKAGYTEIEPMGCVDLAMLSSKTRRGRNMTDKSNCLTTSPDFYQYPGTVNKPIYEVKNGYITIKEKKYPIKLMDGFYIIRKLTVLECMRLQTVPEWYIFPVSDSQAYKMLGNGWTIEVIAHQLSFIPGIFTEEIECVSMYDGMSCGHISLNTLKANVIKYYATEIDKYAIQTTKHNYPDTIHLGDAYQVRNDDWILTSKDGKSYEPNVLQGQMTIDDWLIPNNN